MPRIMADHNVEGHLQVLLTIWSSSAWGDVWRGIGCDLESFERRGIAPDTSDTDLWALCQTHEIVLSEADTLRNQRERQLDVAPLITPDRVAKSITTCEWDFFAPSVLVWQESR